MPSRSATTQKVYRGKPCPDPLKGCRCPLCGLAYACKARTKEKK